MKRFLPIMFLVLLSGAPEVFAKDAKEPTTYAVAYHADWCGSCKILGPKVAEMKAALPKKLMGQVEFVKFDFTDETTKAGSAEMAKEKGLTDLYLNDAKTGQLKIVDIKTGQVLAVIKKDLSVEQMTGVMTAVMSRL